MIELGKMQELTVGREKNFGVFLSEAQGDETAVLLPAKQVPEGTKLGDKLNVFIYRDSSDRLIATTRTPLLTVGEVGVLTVREVGKIGAFLDMGLEKDLLLPFKEQNHPLHAGEQCLVAVYRDKSGRLAATMNVYRYMRSDSPYRKDDRVTGTVYEINEHLGVFVAVDNRYYGMIPEKELYTTLRPGDVVEARVLKVRPDGKLDLSPRQKAYLQMDADAQLVWEAIEARGGSLPFTDKASPEIIKETFHLSKNAFKRAVGQLLREGKIRIADASIEKV